MIYATISADIVDSTKMTTEDMILVSKCLNDFLHPMMKVSKGKKEMRFDVTSTANSKLLTSHY